MKAAEFTLIENAMIERIKAATVVLGYDLKKVDSYGGDFSDGLERIVRDFPAVLITFKGFEPLKQAHTSMTVQAKWAVICCANSLRNEATARQGSKFGVGSYQIVKDMIALFMGQTLGLEITPLMPAGVTMLSNDKIGLQLASIYGLDMTTTFTLDVTPDCSDIANFQTFHADWDIPPVTPQQENLPSDNSAGAIDNVTLEQN